MAQYVSRVRLRRREGDIMVSPLDIMPILALALLIALIPLLADSPPRGRG
jgi:hypothetical protein